MNGSTYNPRITIQSPFETQELPALFCWIERVRASVADDSVPSDMDEWMSYQLNRTSSPSMKTFGIYKDGQIGGYFESIGDSIILSRTLVLAECQAIFKKDLWGKAKGALTAINLCLNEIFSDAVDIAFFPVFSHNRPLRELYWSVGASSIGLIDPLCQNGYAVATEMYTISKPEWEKRNSEFLREIRQSEATEAVEVSL